MSCEGIHQITLPLPFRLDHVHCYLVQGQSGWVIIDTGLHTEQIKNIWERAFTTYKINPKTDVERIVLTHYHPDHFGFAGSLQEWTGAPVYMSEVGKKLALTTWTEERYQQNRIFYRSHGVPDSINEQLALSDRSFFNLTRPFPTEIEVINESTLLFGEVPYEVIPTSGHAEGHLCFFEPNKKVLFAGDHLLKRITPNVSYLGFGDSNPLDLFLKSLETMKEYDVDLVLPGHGPIFHQPQDRIERLLIHHEQRLLEVMACVKGELTSYELCQKLFQRELSVHEIRFALGETIAHLHYSQAKGELKQEIEVDGTIRYMR